MNRTRFHRFLQLPADRRDLTRALAALPLLGGSSVLLEASAAQRDDAAQAEKRKGKKKNSQHGGSRKGKRREFCLNGQQVKARNKKKKRRLRAQGATRGKCHGGSCTPDSFAVTCAARCGMAQNNCGAAVDCGFASVIPVSTAVTTIGTLGLGASNLSSPFDVTLSANELELYIADYGNNRVSIWSRPDASSTAWTNLTTIDIPAALPHGVTLSADERTLYVAYLGLDQIGIWTRPNTSGHAWTLATTLGTSGTGPGQFDDPADTLLSAGELVLYISEYGNDRVSVWTRTSTATNTWTPLTTFGSAGPAPGHFADPVGLAMTSDERFLYVAEYDNNRVSIWTRPDTNSQSWTVATTLPADTGDGPWGIALASNELTMWVSNDDAYSVSIWSRPSTSSLDWTIVDRFGALGSSPDQFGSPTGIALSRDNQTLYISDFSENRVSIWTQTCPA